MSITPLAWVILYCAAILAAFVNPVFGSIGYLLEYYMRPELKWWGDELPSLRYNLIVSVAFGAAFLLRRSSLREMASVQNASLRWLLALGAVMLLVTATFALDTNLSFEWVVQWVKMAVIFPLLVVGAVRTRRTFDLFIVAHVLGAFWWGWESWMDPTRIAGRLVSVGSGDTLDDNSASAHLLTVLPFSVIYLLTQKDKVLRLVALIATPFVVNTLILCNSRGSMVGLLAAVAASFFLIRTGYRLRMVGAAIGMLAFLLVMADTQFITRQQTTASYQEDGSSQQRLMTWRGGIRLLVDRPWGSGGRGFHLLSPRYIPEVVELHGGDFRAPHNTWVMVATEWGVLGLVCFVGVFASAFRMLQRVKSTGEEFYYWRALAIQLAIVGYLVAASFTDRLYAEAGYWMVALSYVLYRMQLTEQAEACRTMAVMAPPEAVAVPSPWPLAHAR